MNVLGSSETTEKYLKIAFQVFLICLFWFLSLQCRILRVNHIYSATTDIKVSSHQSSALGKSVCFPEPQIHISACFEDAFPVS